MKLKQLRKYFPLLISGGTFMSLFVLYVVFSSPDNSVDIQLSPQHSKYFDEYGNPSAYDNKYTSESNGILNVRLNNKPGTSEPMITSNPIKPGVFAVVSNDFTAEGSATVFISENGGKDWTQSAIPLSMIKTDMYYSDPWAEFGSNGNLAFVTVARRNSEYTRNVVFNISHDNGHTWSNTPAIIKEFESKEVKFDKPKVRFDEKGNLFVIWVEESGDENTAISLSKSIDGGKTFSTPFTVERGEIEYADMVFSGSNSYLIYSEESEYIKIKTSNDGGSTWSSPELIAEYEPHGEVLDRQRVIKRMDERGVRVNSDPQIAVANGMVHVTYSALSDNGESSEVYYVSGGLSDMKFSEPVPVSDNPHSDKFMPALTFDNKGNLHILYYSSQNDPDNIMTDAYLASSFDNGKTFTYSKLSTHSFNPLDIVVGGSYMGDYISIASSKDGLVAVWTDGRSGNIDLMAGIVKSF